jgi:hypothetical protein
METLARHIRQDEGLVATIVARCQEEAEKAQLPDPTILPKLHEEVDRYERQIQFAIDNLGDSPEDETLAQRQVKELKNRRSAALGQVARLKGLQKNPVRVPTDRDVRAMIDDLGNLLAMTGEEPDDESTPLLRRTIELLTGGRIDLFQLGESRRHGGWLQGRFRCRLLKYLIEQATGRAISVEDDGIDIVIDYRRPRPSEALAKEALRLDDADEHMRQEIAKMVGVSRGRLTGLLKQASADRGRPFVDGRTRRERLRRKQSIAPQYVEIADKVQALMQQGHLLQEIGNQLGEERHVITKAMQHWYKSRGLPVPDGRTRRRDLKRKTSKPRQKSFPVEDGAVGSS